MAFTMVRPGEVSPRRARSLLPFNWAILLLFLLFTAVIGVREAKAQPEFTIGLCVGACTTSFRDVKSTSTCAACLIWFMREARLRFWGDTEPAGYGCAKTGFGCPL